jgi:hypothetical protein
MTYGRINVNPGKLDDAKVTENEAPTDTVTTRTDEKSLDVSK